MRREFGGCAGNIAYNLKLLGGEPLIMATVGQDSAPYLERFEQLGISRKCIRVIDTSFTAQCFVTTDAGGNQINAFHPGAMTFSHETRSPMPVRSSLQSWHRTVATACCSMQSRARRWIFR